MARKATAQSGSYVSELASQQRVFHPSASSYMDIDPATVDDWTDAGWELSPGAHVNAESFPELRDTDAALAAEAAKADVGELVTPTDPSQQ